MGGDADEPVNEAGAHWRARLSPERQGATNSPEKFGPLVIKILCAAAQLGLGSSPDFNGTKKH